MPFGAVSHPKAFFIACPCGLAAFIFLLYLPETIDGVEKI